MGEGARLRLELRGIVESSGGGSFALQADGTVRVHLDAAITRELQAFRTRLESARFDALRDVAVVRMRTAWLPAFTLSIPRESRPRGLLRRAWFRPLATFLARPGSSLGDGASSQR